MPDSTTVEQAAADSRGPAPITVPPGVRAAVDVPPEDPAVAEARDQLLSAIGQQARSAAGLEPEQAAKVLGELARSYALVTQPQAPWMNASAAAALGPNVFGMANGGM
ncbi:hypothetical protein ACIRD3_31960 [Kitasatospora sp. NPDC093550]|uniref:hypothetical protein n=1 Tax=Kitasatospora sp. NPDC093550 TaxID=3364089 RepID=UPI00382D96F5